MAQGYTSFIFHTRMKIVAHPKWSRGVCFVPLGPRTTTRNFKWSTLLCFMIQLAIRSTRQNWNVSVLLFLVYATLLQRHTQHQACGYTFTMTFYFLCPQVTQGKICRDVPNFPSLVCSYVGTHDYYCNAIFYKWGKVNLAHLESGDVRKTCVCCCLREKHNNAQTSIIQGWRACTRSSVTVKHRTW